MPLSWNLEEHFHRLPSDFYTLMPPEGAGKHPNLIHASPIAASLLDLSADTFANPEFPRTFAGLDPLPDFRSLAMVYAGHQFGGYVPRLGDGRAILIAQVRNRAGELWDVQLKGAGRTPYSRFGDGRAVLRSVIREYLCSEAMAALGIPTTRALCIVATGEAVRREKLEPGAVLTRLARSHVRFGHFEYFHHTQRPSRVAELIEYVRAEFFPDLDGAPVSDWFQEVVRRTAAMVAQWQAVGFAHGVMNTDNMSILGHTIDYGPFGFMEAYDPGFICNHSDETGRYAFDQQPGIAKWNLWALANALLTQSTAQSLGAALQEFDAAYAAAYFRAMLPKLGIQYAQPNDAALLAQYLELLQAAKADYTLAWRNLEEGGESWIHLFAEPQRADAEAWRNRWKDRVKEEPSGTTQTANPKYVLRNWVAETIIRAVEDRQDIAFLDRSLRVFESPYHQHPTEDWMAAPAPPTLRNLCVSCSS
jgi:hypothetical protein